MGTFTCSNIADVNLTVSNIVAYPNPGKGNIKISGFDCNGCDISVFITDFTGRVLYHTVERTTTNMLTMDVDFLASGAYMLICDNGKNTASTKLIIQ